MKFATKPIYEITHITLGKLKNHIFADIQQVWNKMQTNCSFTMMMMKLPILPCAEKLELVLFIASNFVIHSQILIFSVFKIATFLPYWLQIIFYVTVLLLVSFCDQSVAPKIRQSSQQTSLQCLSTTNMNFSDEDKILIKAHKLLSIHSYTRKGIEIDALKMQFICISAISAEYV